MKKTNITDALFSKTRQKVLGILYGHSESSFYTNEIIRAAACGSSSVQRELQNLTSSGLVLVEPLGNQKRYKANSAGPFFEELRSIVLKSFGLSDVIIEALEPIANKIKFAFIYGSIAKHTETSSSDVDLMIVGDNITYADVFSLLDVAEKKLIRKINPTFYSLAEWIKKINDENVFLSKIMNQPKIFLIGAEDEFVKFRQLSGSKLTQERTL